MTAVSDIYALNSLSQTTEIAAEDGQPGMTNRKSGKTGQDVEIRLPTGTTLTDTDSQEAFEITGGQDRFLLCQGGRGGKGNWEYRSAANTTPTYAQKGAEGQRRSLHINLRLIADYGLIGFPNAGKSSLLKELTAADPKVGSYPFTTLEPNLGELDGKIMADIPGLIQGASQGKGLGIKFLKHIERVSLLLHCISCESGDPQKDYLTIRHELEAYNSKLLDLDEIILLTKTDLKSEAEVKSILAALRSLTREILPVSIHDWASLETLKETCTRKKGMRN